MLLYGFHKRICTSDLGLAGQGSGWYTENLRMDKRRLLLRETMDMFCVERRSSLMRTVLGEIYFGDVDADD